VEKQGEILDVTGAFPDLDMDLVGVHMEAKVHVYTWKGQADSELEGQEHNVMVEWVVHDPKQHGRDVSSSSPQRRN